MSDNAKNLSEAAAEASGMPVLTQELEGADQPATAAEMEATKDELILRSASYAAVKAGSTVPLLEVVDLEVAFQSSTGMVPAVRKANFCVYPGQTIAIVGEAGSG